MLVGYRGIGKAAAMYEILTVQFSKEGGKIGFVHVGNCEGSVCVDGREETGYGFWRLAIPLYWADFIHLSEASLFLV